MTHTHCGGGPHRQAADAQAISLPPIGRDTPGTHHRSPPGPHVLHGLQERGPGRGPPGLRRLFWARVYTVQRELVRDLPSDLAACGFGVDGRLQCMPCVHQNARGRQAPSAHPPQNPGGWAQRDASGNEAFEQRPRGSSSSTSRAQQPAAFSPAIPPGRPPPHQDAPLRRTRRPLCTAVSRTGRAIAGGCARHPRARRRLQRSGLPHLLPHLPLRWLRLFWLPSCQGLRAKSPPCSASRPGSAPAGHSTCFEAGRARITQDPGSEHGVRYVRAGQRQQASGMHASAVRDARHCPHCTPSPSSTCRPCPPHPRDFFRGGALTQRRRRGAASVAPPALCAPCCRLHPQTRPPRQAGSPPVGGGQPQQVNNRSMGAVWGHRCSTWLAQGFVNFP